MNDLIDKLKEAFSDRRILFWSGAALFFILLFVLLSNYSPKKTAEVEEKPKEVLVQKNAADKPGLFLGEDIDRKAFVGRLEDQYHTALEKNRQIETRLEILDKKLAGMVKNQEIGTENMRALESKLAESQEMVAQAASLAGGEGSADTANYRLEVVNIAPVTAPEAEGVYLPPGSFVRGTLLTGLYAPVDQNNPLPVLIRLNEAFYGPNETRIPLEGAFVIGKASGELNSERALVQAVTLSTVLPNGQTVQQQGNIGYITDIYGELGLKGAVVRNTGAKLAASFMSGFVGGTAQAVADGETTVTTTAAGRVSRNVTGSIGRHATFQGLTQSAAQLSKYYADQLSAIVPAIRVEAGVELYLIILEGAKINGLKVNKPADIKYLD